MAKFDFKKALKEGIEKKKIKKGILKEVSLTDPQFGTRSPGGGTNKWTDGRRGPWIEKWQELEPTAADYTTKRSEIENKMRASLASAVSVILNDIGASKYITDSDMKDIALGILYWSILCNNFVR